MSTCGLVPRIRQLAEEDLTITLALSLHAPNDELRSKIMPINKVYKLNDLINTLRKYIDMTGRRVTFEYIMLGGINDSLTCADELASLLKNMNCYVNLIPYNETSHIEFVKSTKENILAFYDRLKSKGINVTIRREFGSKVMAACGQLRANYEEGK